MGTSINYDQISGAIDSNTLSLENYLTNRHVVNVRDFGAVGDGVTDDTASFVAALAAADTVEITGEYNYRVETDNRLTEAGIPNPFLFKLTDNKVIKGDGRATLTVTATSNLHADLFSIDGTNITIEGVKATGQAYSMNDAGNAETTGGIYYAVSGLKSRSYADTIIRNCSFQYCLSGGIVFGAGDGENMRVEKNKIEDVRGIAIGFLNTEKIHVLDNTILTQQTFRENPVGASGETFQGLGIDISEKCRDVVVDGNLIDDCVFGIKHERDETVASQDSSISVITNNVVKNVNLNSQYTADAYAIKPSANNCIVSNNIIETSYSQGIIVSNGTSDQIQIDGNMIVGCTREGIRVLEKDNQAVPAVVNRLLTTISNNTILGTVPGESAGLGINIESGYATILGNKIYNVSSGIQLSLSAAYTHITGNTIYTFTTSGIVASSDTGASPTVNGLVINDNHILGSGAGAKTGILLSHVDQSNICNNRLEFASASTAARGIYIDNAASALGDLNITGNYVKSFWRNIQCDDIDSANIVGNTITGHGSTDRGISTSTMLAGNINSNFIRGCADAIVALADTTETLIATNNTSQSTAGITSTNSVLANNLV